MSLLPSELQEGFCTNYASCVVIHGWSGHALGSFKSARPPYVWLRDSLPNDCPQLRIWTYGYRSVLTDQESIADVFEYAKTFKQHLRSLRQKTKVRIPHPLPLSLAQTPLFEGKCTLYSYYIYRAQPRWMDPQRSEYILGWTR